MVFVRSSKVTNGWLVTIHDPESFIVTLQGYALQGYNGFLGVIHGYQFHWSLSRTLQMVHLNCSYIIQFSIFNVVEIKVRNNFGIVFMFWLEWNTTHIVLHNWCHYGHECIFGHWSRGDHFLNYESTNTEYEMLWLMNRNLET